MNQSKIFFICALGSLLSLGAVQASGAVVDNFDSYTNASYIQVQNTAWSRSGTALTDGIASITDGALGNGARFSMAWTAGNAARVKYDFASPQAYSLGVTFTMDLKTSVAITGTAVVGVITDSTGTTWATSIGQTVANTGYTTYSFTFDAGTATRTGGTTTSLVTALNDVKSFTMQLTNAGGAGSQQISFDNLTVTNASAVPEPSTVAVLMGAAAGLLCVGSKWRKKRLTAQS